MTHDRIYVLKEILTLHRILMLTIHYHCDQYAILCHLQSSHLILLVIHLHIGGPLTHVHILYFQPGL